MKQLLFDDPSAVYRLEIDYHGFTVELTDYFGGSLGMPLGEISFTAGDFLHDIVTCGIPAFQASGYYRRKRSEEIRYKYHLMRAVLEAGAGGYLRVSDAINFLDSSERAFASYYIGMFITKLVGREIFDYEYLVHLGIVSRYKSVVRDSAEPDLVGFRLRSDEYSLFEAKGRQNVQTQMVKEAKAQLRSVKYIGGRKPVCGIVCVSHPVKAGRGLVCSMYDPEPDGNGTLDVSKGELLYLYYLPIYELIRETGGSFLLEESGSGRTECRVGMPRELFDLFERHPVSEGGGSAYAFRLMEMISELSDHGGGDLLEVGFYTPRG